MPLERTRRILERARAGAYGVCAFNCINYETVSYVIEAAEEACCPVIVQMYYAGGPEYMPLEAMAGIVQALARRTTVPVGLNLDHGNSLETCVMAVEAGFTSVMFDGSNLPLDENAARTRQVVDAAHAAGVDVEGELGHVGSAARIEDFTDPRRFTDPRLAAEFVRETGVDALAIAAGSAHGRYVAEPKLDFDRIRRIRALADVPLVLHGGSGIPADQLRRAVESGLAKFNIATDFLGCFYESVRAAVNDPATRSFSQAMMSARPPVKEFIHGAMAALGHEAAERA